MSLREDILDEQYRLAAEHLNIITSAATTESKKELEGLRNEVAELKFAVRLLQDASGYRVEPVKQRTSSAHARD